MTAHNSVKNPSKSATSGNRIIGFFKELKAEFKRITWASKDNIKKATATVMTFCAIYVVLVGLFDYIFKQGISLIFK